MHKSILNSNTNSKCYRAVYKLGSLLRFAAVVKCKVNNTWENWNLDSKIKEQLQTLGVEFN